MSLRRVLAIAGTDLLISHASAGVLIFRVAIPIALIIVTGYANGAFNPSGGSVSTVSVDVYDQDGSSESTVLFERLQATESRFAFELRESTEPDRRRQRLTDRKATAAVVIPDGFGSDMRGAGDAEIRIVSEDQTSETVQSLQPVVSGAAREVAGVVSAESWARSISSQLDATAEEYASRVRFATLERWRSSPVEVTREQVTPVDPERTVRSWGGGFKQSVPGMGSMYALFAVLAGVSTLIWERKNGTLGRIATLPVRAGEFIGGKVLSRVLVGMVQFIVAFATGLVIAAVTGISFPIALPALAMIALAFSFMGAALALLMATLVETPEQADGVTTFLALTLAPIGGAWWSLDLEFIPEIMRQVAVISPFYWAMEGFKSLLMYSGDILDVLPHCGVLAGIGVVLFLSAVLRFRIRD